MSLLFSKVILRLASRHVGSKSLQFAVVLGLLVIAGQIARAQTESVLYNFCSQPNCADGSYPSGSLVQDANGNLYGTTGGGGSNPACPNGCGTVFRLSPDGTYTVLYSFGGALDGSGPYSGLVFDQSGNLYGITCCGGLPGGAGWGTVFKLSSAGTEQVLYTFCQNHSGYLCLDGGSPNGPLILDPQGNVYGTTFLGGSYGCSEGGGCGIVFEVTPAGVETVLYNFTGGADDGNPYGGLVRDAEGNLYGTDAQPWDLGIYPGTVFKLTPAGMETQIYSFNGASSGGSAAAGLIEDTQGNFYGTTYYGGNNSCYDGWQNGCGVVFELSPRTKKKYKEIVLYRFRGKNDGGYPGAPVVQDAQGNLYGTTAYGGNLSCNIGYLAGCGVVFKIPAKHKEVVLYTFTGGSDGGIPESGLLLDAHGNLYGTTGSGGAYGKGVIFKVTP